MIAFSRQTWRVFCMRMTVAWAMPCMVSAQTELVKWTFPGNSSLADGGVSANSNRVISTVGALGTVTFTNVTDSQSTTLAARATGWDDGADGKAWVIQFTSVDFADLTVSSRQRSSTAGPGNFKIQYRLGESEWEDVPGGHVLCGNNWTQGVAGQLPLGEACSGQPSVAIRWIMADNTRVSGDGDVSAAGASYIDDIIVRGRRVWLPAPLALKATDIRSTQFTINWPEVEGATGYLLDVARAGGFAAGGLTPDARVIDFEGAGETKTAYTSGVVNLSGLSWELNEVLIGTLAIEWKDGGRSARLRGHGGSAMTLLEDLTNGLGMVTFQYRRYGTDPLAVWRVECSADGGGAWTQTGPDFTASGSGDVQTFSNRVVVPANARVRIRCASDTGTVDHRLNIDNITLASYDPGDYVTGYEARPVSNATAVVDGLTRGWYYSRVRATDGVVVSGYSVPTTVRASDSPPGTLVSIH